MNLEEFDKLPELNTVNDITEVFNKNELNLDLTHLSDHILLGTDKNFTNKTNDIRNNLDTNINLSLNKKIYIKNIKTSNFDSVYNNKKLKKVININENNPKIGDYILDIRVLDNINNIGLFYPDIYKPKLSFKTQLKQKNKILFKRFIKIYYFILKPLIYISIFLFFIGSYLYLIQLNIKSGFGRLNNINITDNLNITLTKIKKSNNDLIFAKTLFLPISYFNKILNIGLLNNLDYLLDGGTRVTKAGIYSIEGFNSIKLLITNKPINEINFSDLLVNFRPIFTKINNNINLSIIDFNNIDFYNNNLNDKLNNVINILSKIKTYTNNINTNYDSILTLLGHDKIKKYAVLLQNSDENRSTGGFIGSLGEIDVFRGNIKNFKTRDVYSYEWDIKPYKELPPEGINRITNNFGLRDSNYYIEYQKNSKKVKFFLNKAKINIDGVLYVNLILIEDILDLIGGVQFDKIDKKITGVNFSTIISILVEAKIYKSGSLVSPKTILFDFIEEFKKKVISYHDKEKLLKLVLKNFNNGEIVFNTFDKNEDKILKLFKLNGVKEYDKDIDFNYPIFTSISGNKSDRFLDISFIKSIRKNKDCTIDTSLNISLNHTFSSNDEVHIKELLYNFGINEFKNYEDIMNIQGRGENKQFIRIVLPKDSIIENGDKLHEKRTSNYKVVSFYIDTYPQENKNFIIKYKIPNYSCNEYSYTFYKQAGIRKYDLDFELNNVKINKKGLEGNFNYE